ncbi:MAG: twin-arginine translocation signal domain-containing protein, partial [Candidatus Nealsonbacteria bacterium]|nr:twin-arginine translocation signal domain-containing protein [Candidatus Nealsonbacteria bacterium]
METKPTLSRRSFLKRSGTTAVALATPMVVPGHVLGKGAPAPSERIVLGVIGYGGRCSRILGHFMSFGDVQCIATSDCRSDRLAAAKKVVDARYGNQDCATYADFRDLLARRDVDAVLI